MDKRACHIVISVAWILSGLLPVAFLDGCSSEQEPDAPPTAMVEHGRKVYAMICASCHNPDPTKDRTEGPPIAGSSLELIRMRVLSKKYPEGYTPKRDTSAMTTFALADMELRALHAYLQDAAK